MYFYHQSTEREVVNCIRLIVFSFLTTRVTNKSLFSNFKKSTKSEQRETDYTLQFKIRNKPLRADDS